MYVYRPCNFNVNIFYHKLKLNAFLQSTTTLLNFQAYSLKTVLKLHVCLNIGFRNLHKPK